MSSSQRITQGLSLSSEVICLKGKLKKEIMEKKLDMLLDICTHLLKCHKHHDQIYQYFIVPAWKTPTKHNQVGNQEKKLGLNSNQ